jgi:hypothetical protein
MKRAAKQALANLQGGGGGGGGGGGQQGAGGYSYSQPMPFEQLQSLAQSLAQGQLQPLQQEIANQQANLQQQLGQQTGLINSLTAELGPMVSGIAPAIQQTYQQAAQNQAQFAEGFSEGMREIAQGQAAQDAAFLQNVAGAPAAQVEQTQQAGAGGADALHGQGGYLPASSLGRAGAAFTAFGQTMPAVVARMGQQDVAALTSMSQREQASLAKQAADLMAQLPARSQEILLDLLQQEQAKFEANRQYRLQEVAAQQAAAALGWDRERWAAEMGIDQSRWEAEFGADVAAGQADARADRNQRRNEAKKARNKYLENIGDRVPKIYKELQREFASASSGGGGFDPTRPPGAQGATGPKKLKYQQAFNRIYGELKAAFGIPGKRGWKFGVRDAAVKKMIREYLASLGLRPPASVSPSALSGAGPGPGTGPPSAMGIPQYPYAGSVFPGGV